MALGGELSLDYQCNKQKRRVANAERTLFQPPLHLLRGVTSRHNLRVAVGNGTDARQRNFSHPQAICSSEIPPCSLSRADLGKNFWFCCKRTSCCSHQRLFQVGQSQKPTVVYPFSFCSRNFCVRCSTYKSWPASSDRSQLRGCAARVLASLASPALPEHLQSTRTTNP